MGNWLHVPGSAHQGTKPFFGPYTYTVTPRYFDGNRSLQALDPTLSVAVKIDMKPFAVGDIEAGFTRGFTQSQAFVRHFGKKALISPKKKELLFDTSQISGKDDQGKTYTFEEEYEWLGFTAREKLLALVAEVVKTKKLTLDVFAYDLSEPDLMKAFLALAKEGRIRIILDNAGLHHSKTDPKPEDQFEALFRAAAKAPADILRGNFDRYSHDKVFIVYQDGAPLKVLTGSTNFSVTGLYVNSNHVIVFHDKKVTDTYAQVFKAAWEDKVSASKFRTKLLATQPFSFSSAKLAQTEITFSPHDEAFANTVLSSLVQRIKDEEAQPGGSVLFAVMGLDKKSTGPVFPVLREIHSNQDIFSYGISDTPEGIVLYTPRRKRPACSSQENRPRQSCHRRSIKCAVWASAIRCTTNSSSADSTGKNRSFTAARRTLPSAVRRTTVTISSPFTIPRSPPSSRSRRSASSTTSIFSTAGPQRRA